MRCATEAVDSVIARSTLVSTGSPAVTVSASVAISCWIRWSSCSTDAEGGNPPGPGSIPSRPGGRDGIAAAGAGVGVAGRHVWLQNLPPDQVPACGAGYDYIMDTLPFGEALRVIFSGSGECATVDWQFLGLSMPAWVLISVAVVGAAGIWNNLRGIGVNRG